MISGINVIASVKALDIYDDNAENSSIEFYRLAKAGYCDGKNLYSVILSYDKVDVLEGTYEIEGLVSMLGETSVRKSMERVDEWGTVASRKAAPKKSAKKGALDFFKFVSTDENRYFMSGVYHDKGFKVATDGRILAMAKAEYEQKFEGVILSKSLVPIEGQFPPYKKVLPDLSKMEKAEFDFKKVKDALKKNGGVIKVYKGLTRHTLCGKTMYGRVVYELPNGATIDSDIMLKAIHFAECYPDSVLYVSKDSTRACALVSGDVDTPGAMCVFMPCVCESKTAIGGAFSFGESFHGITADEILRRCGKSDILQRQEYGTMTEKDIAFLKDVHDFMAIFRKEKKEVA